ncbi:MAG: hypothetical protein OEY03_03395 [Rhizobacter sp.]|nr:hypothetical protein [Rhizobacter sp.]
MSRITSHWFSPKADGEQSSVERERLRALRQSRLEQHVLAPTRAAAALPRNSGGRVPIPDLRDPLDLHSGLDITYLSESAFGDLFEPAGR